METSDARKRREAREAAAAAVPAVDRWAHHDPAVRDLIRRAYEAGHASGMRALVIADARERGES